MKLAAFDKGTVPTISVVNQAKTPLGFDLAKFVVALQKYVDQCFAPIWHESCKLVLSTNGKIPANNWAIVFTDTADEAGALGYHDLTPAGLPLSHVFVKTTLDDGGSVTVTASHELAEMLVDAGCQLWADDASGTKSYAYETADAVEETDFDIDGFRMSNFVYPAWFEGFRKPGSTKFDYLGLVKKPFELLKGGYSIVRKAGKVSNVFGSLAKITRFKKKDRRLRRSTRRG